MVELVVIFVVRVVWVMVEVVIAVVLPVVGGGFGPGGDGCGGSSHGVNIGDDVFCECGDA